MQRYFALTVLRIICILVEDSLLVSMLQSESSTHVYGVDMEYN
jgi:hypothetical protein